MKILGPLFIFIIFAIIFVLFIYIYSKILNKIPIKYKVLLLSLRTAIILFLLVLLINPWIQFAKINKYNQNIDAIFDISSSMENHYLNENIDVSTIIKKIDKWGINNNLNIDFLKLGSASVDQYKYNNTYVEFTDFSGLEEYVLFNNGPRQPLR